MVQWHIQSKTTSTHAHKETVLFAFFSTRSPFDIVLQPVLKAKVKHKLLIIR